MIGVNIECPDQHGRQNACAAVSILEPSRTGRASQRPGPRARAIGHGESCSKMTVRRRSRKRGRFWRSELRSDGYSPPAKVG
jgi:hypothetical protein